MSEENLQTLLKLFFRGIIPVVFLISGLVVFTSEMTGWNLIIGLPLIIFGTVFLLYTYDEVITKEIKPLDELVECIVCGQLTPRLPRVIPEDTVCPECKRKIIKEKRIKV